MSFSMLISASQFDAMIHVYASGFKIGSVADG